MEQRPRKSNRPHLPNFPAGYISNDTTEPYQLEADSTTGFVAWKRAEGETLITRSILTTIRPSLFISFWACAGVADTTPAGSIRFFDCHGCGITRLDVQSLTELEFLDASFNRLTELSLKGLNLLQGLDVEGNQLRTLDLRGLHSLRVLDCTSNILVKLQLPNESTLQILECSGNPLRA